MRSHKGENVITSFSLFPKAHSSRSAQQNLGAKERSDVGAIVTCHQGPAEGPWVSALWVGSWMFETGMTERP